MDREKMTVPIVGLDGKAPYVMTARMACDRCLEQGVDEAELEGGLIVWFDGAGYAAFFECDLDPDAHDDQTERRWTDTARDEIDINGEVLTKAEVIEAVSEQDRAFREESEGR